MTDLENGELRVVVPVGFLLDEEQEVTVSVDRPDGNPLPIRLCLIPARTTIGDPTPVAVAGDIAGAVIGWPSHRLASRSRYRYDHDSDFNDGYPGHDVGGGD
jgi:hypothetical protein